jgi:hypothetical protein
MHLLIATDKSSSHNRGHGGWPAEEMRRCYVYMYVGKERVGEVRFTIAV